MWSDEPGVPDGGSCYNCHQLSPQEAVLRHHRPEPARLRQAARQRRRDCRSTPTARSTTPRPTTCARRCRASATSGTLNEQQIKDLVGAAARPGLAGQPVACSGGNSSVCVGLAAAAGASLRPGLSAGAGGSRALRPAALRQRLPAALHRLPRAAAADLFPRAERQHRRRRGGRPRPAPGGRAPAQAGGPATGHDRGARLHVPGFRARRAHATARSGGFAHLATLVKRLRAARPQRAAARRRRHLAGLGRRRSGRAART